MSAPETDLEEGFNSEIRVLVYTGADGFRWQVRSASRGRRILAASSEAYKDKAGALRSLELTIGGEYVQSTRRTSKETGVYEQGIIMRRSAQGDIEGIRVEYRSKVSRDGIEETQ